VFEEKWKNFQYTVLGPNSLPEIHNANQARIRGLETNVNWKATDDLLLTGSAAWYNAKLTANYCGTTDANGNPITNCAVPLAPKGTQLPITPKFKANLIARYGFDFQGMDAYVQGAFVHVGARTSDLRLIERDLLGNLPAYNTFDLSAGIKRNNWALDAYVENAFDTHGEMGRFSECTPQVCAAHGQVAAYPNGQSYVIPIQPRTYGLRFTQDFY
jgi:outer membrane receptor protein involved in Fe transport